MIRTLLAVIGTEFTKLRHTATWWFSILVPVFVILVDLIAVLDEYFSRGFRSYFTAPHAWDLYLREVWPFWAVAMPVLIMVEAVGLAGLEHAGNQWKQLYTLPLPRWNIGVSKVVVCLLLTIQSTAIFAAAALLLGLLRGALFQVAMASAIPWSLLFRLTACTVAASGAVISLQVWLSMRFAGFAIPCGIGLAAMMIGGSFARWHVAAWWPWTMPFGNLPWQEFRSPALLGPLLCVAITAAAVPRLAQREVR